MHHVYAALRAKHLYNRDQHYVVQQGEDGSPRSSSSTSSPAA